MMKSLTSYEENVVRRVAVGDMLIRTAARYPHMKALCFRDRNYSFAELNTAVNRCARTDKDGNHEGRPLRHFIP